MRLLGAGRLMLGAGCWACSRTTRSGTHTPAISALLCCAGFSAWRLPLAVARPHNCLPAILSVCRTEEEDVEVTEDAKDLLTKIGVETSLR